MRQRELVTVNRKFIVPAMREAGTWLDVDDILNLLKLNRSDKASNRDLVIWILEVCINGGLIECYEPMEGYACYRAIPEDRQPHLDRDNFLQNARRLTGTFQAAIAARLHIPTSSVCTFEVEPVGVHPLPNVIRYAKAINAKVRLLLPDETPVSTSILRAIRKEARLSQPMVAAALGYSYSGFSKAEINVLNLKLFRIRQIFVEVFGMPVRLILELEGHDPLVHVL